jgi:DNA-binding transcriptional MerR regulator
MGAKILKRGYKSIGAVVETLNKEFKDLSISKIRYLEDQGLIEPKRTTGGYRRFTDGDVERLRLVLKLQKERYLPLIVIREKIKHLSTGRVKGSDLLSLPKEEIPVDKSLLGAEKRFSREEASEATGFTAKEISELESYGLVQSEKSDKGETFSSGNVKVMHLAKSLSRHGIQPRHLRLYQNFAERESTLMEQIVAPVLKQKSDDAQQKAIQTLTELADLSRQLREVLLNNSLRSFLKQP